MKLPFLVSVPHAGLYVPPEVRDICILTPEEIFADSDAGAAEIYHDLQESAAASCSSDIARAIVDLNRAADNFGKDGVIKTHTCYDVPVYNRIPSQNLIEKLLTKYYYPYHQKLHPSAYSKKIKIGIDCHTMAEVGPPIGPDAGRQRPLVCISNAAGTCPDKWLSILAESFQKIFPHGKVNINEPFKGGYIIRSYSTELPWLQIEISRTERVANSVKKAGVFKALSAWSSIIFE